MGRFRPETPPTNFGRAQCMAAGAETRKLRIGVRSYDRMPDLPRVTEWLRPPNVWVCGARYERPHHPFVRIQIIFTMKDMKIMKGENPVLNSGRDKPFPIPKSSCSSCSSCSSW